jgi:hypothetical protein
VATSAKKRQAPPAWTTHVIILAVVLACVGAGFWYLYLRVPADPQQVGALSPEAKAYVGNLGLSGVEMKATESYMKNTLVEIVGKITNNGGRSLRVVEINCRFFDPYGQLILRERVPIVRRGTGAGMKPGETRDFRLPFDNIPASWNQTLPQLVIARIDFEN